MGYVILREGSTNVALLNGCLCFLMTTFSLAGTGAAIDPSNGTETSGNPIFLGIGLPFGVTEGETVPTNLLNPIPILPDRALRVPPTTADTLPGDPKTPVPPGDPIPDGPAEEPASSVSKNPLPEDVPDVGPPTTLAARSLSLLPRVGLGGGGGGFRIPLVGGLGRRLAGERGAVGVAGGCKLEDGTAWIDVVRAG